MARVVVADNDPEALDLAVLDLELEGHTVLGVPDGASALAAVESFTPDVLVLDYRMPPGPTGLAVASTLRRQHPDLRLIIYSNYPDPGIIRDATNIGVSFLTKGDLRALRARVVQ